jgi:hypothetical protein
MLAEKLEGNLARTVVEPKKALDFAQENGAIMSLSASWHRTVEGENEAVDMGEFMFLLAKEGKPIQLQVSYEKGKFAKEATDISGEMGDVSDEEEFFKSVKFLTDQQILDKIEADGRTQKALLKAKHLRVYSMDFVMYDESYEAPVWHVILKNWPLTNYFRKEKTVTVEAVVEATRGKVITLAVYS